MAARPGRLGRGGGYADWVGVLVGLVLLLIAEIFVIAQVAHQLGVFTTLVLLVLFSVSGPWLVRRTGLGVWRRAQERLGQGDVPGREIVDGVLLLLAGVLLTVPGFITGVAGLLLLLPPVRSLVRVGAGGWLRRRASFVVLSGRGGGGDDVITADSRPVDRRPPALGRPTGGPADEPGAAGSPGAAGDRPPGT
jgi:UPF0716 protein FxsA